MKINYKLINGCLILSLLLLNITFISAYEPVIMLGRNHSRLFSLNWSVAGHLINTDLNLTNNSLIGVNQIIAGGNVSSGKWFNGLFNFFIDTKIEPVSNNLLFFNGTTMGLNFTYLTRHENSTYLNLSGTNANQNVSLGTYDFLANKYFGKFNWVINDTINNPTSVYLNFNDTTLTFLETGLNATIDHKIKTTYHNTTQSSIISGSIDLGVLENTHHQDGSYDGVTFNFSEQAGSPALDLRMNFTGITDFNKGVMRYYTSAIAGSNPLVQLWSYTSSEWKDYPQFVESMDWVTIEQSVFDNTAHIGTTGIYEGVVQMRIYKASNGNINNEYYVDWVAIIEGAGTPSGEEVDPFSVHKKEFQSAFDSNFTADQRYNETDDIDAQNDSWISTYNKTYDEQTNLTDAQECSYIKMEGGRIVWVTERC